MRDTEREGRQRAKEREGEREENVNIGLYQPYREGEREKNTDK